MRFDASIDFFKEILPRRAPGERVPRRFFDRARQRRRISAKFITAIGTKSRSSPKCEKKINKSGNRGKPRTREEMRKRRRKEPGGGGGGGEEEEKVRRGEAEGTKKMKQKTLLSLR